MKITYNEFVDNGLYVAAYYLNKDIDDLDIDDLEKNINLFTDKVYEFINCAKYKKIATMAFYNSSYTQNQSNELKEKYKDKAKLESIRNQFNVLFHNVGHEEICSICNERHVKITGLDKKYVSMLSRSLMPNLTSNTFFNYSNNLQRINVCPVCIFLSMISLLNMRKEGNLIIYNSEDKEFMKELTILRQIQNERDILLDAEEINKGNTLNLQEEVLTLIKEKSRNNHIMVYVFNNSGQSQTYEDLLLTKQNIELYKKIYITGNMEEFHRLNLFRLLLDNSIAYKYMYYIANFKDERLKSSIGLLGLLEDEVSILKKEVRESIISIGKKIYDMTSKDNIKELKSISNYNAFEDYLIKCVEEYKDKSNENLLTEEQFEILMDPKNWRNVKNRMILQFILLKED